MHEDVKVIVVNYPDRTNLVMRYTDPMTGRQITRSARTTKKREAERNAAKWEADLREGRYCPPSKITWTDFRERYDQEKLAYMADKTQVAATSALNHVERLLRPRRLADLTANTLSTFQARLVQTDIRSTSVATHLRHIRAALGWARKIGMLTKVPEFEMPRQAKRESLMRGRPITGEEFDRMIDAVNAVRKQDAADWKQYLTGLWLSGLRLGESLELSWEEEAGVAVDLSGKHPRLRILAESEKGKRDRLLPMTPDFAEFILATPEHHRSGRVFAQGRLQSKTVGRVVSAIGKKAGVVVNKAEGKYASAHDLRRAFGTRWAPRLKPATLQLLMRHKSIETTLKYYVSQDADDVAAELWAQHKKRDANQVTV